VQEPMFLNRQVFVNVAFASNSEPSGTVTSATNCAQSQVAADTPVGNASAGTDENTNAINNIVEVILIRDFIILFSSSPSNSFGRTNHVKSSTEIEYNVTLTIIQYHINDSFSL